ncbi:MAG TPA: response regulator [Candidatus Aquilonibacter sp.]|nr:response regulator [Candidatus Aquilonibacter sp.]
MRHRVLVVDDDRLVADTLRMVFAANGFESEACYSAAEGFRVAKSFSPELMLCDVTMPGEDGLKLAARIFDELPECQLLMLTAYLSKSATEELEALRRRRPIRLLNKPCPPEVLLEEALDLLRPGSAISAAS